MAIWDPIVDRISSLAEDLKSLSPRNLRKLANTRVNDVVLRVSSAPRSGCSSFTTLSERQHPRACAAADRREEGAGVRSRGRERRLRINLVPPICW